MTRPKRTPAPRFRLHDLPPELRLEIYRHALSLSMSNTVATFARPISVPDFYDWVDRRWVSASMFLRLAPFAEDFCAAAWVKGDDDVLYVDDPLMDWRGLVKWLGVKIVVVDTRSWPTGCEDVSRSYRLFERFTASRVFEGMTLLMVQAGSRKRECAQLWSSVKCDRDGRNFGAMFVRVVGAASPGQEFGKRALLAVSEVSVMDRS